MAKLDDALVRVGQKLSNIAYNFGHNYATLTEHDRRVMAVCALDWDNALKAVRSTRKPKRKASK